MKKVICLLTVFAMLFGMVGCNNTYTTSSPDESIVHNAEINTTKNSEIAIMHFKKAFAGEEHVWLDGASQRLAHCATYEGPVYQQQTQRIAYIDFDNDHITEVLIDYGAYGNHILYYDFEDSKIYATFFTPRGGCVFFENGEYWYNDTSIYRYKIKQFNKGNIETITVEYTNPIIEKPKWVDIAIPNPDAH